MRVLSGEAQWLDWIFDGAGEAGIDLTPGSVFLQTLNARPNPTHTELTVIAAVLTRFEQQALSESAARLRDRASSDSQAGIDDRRTPCC